MLPTKCPACGRTGRVHEDLRAKRVKCPKCGETFVVKEDVSSSPLDLKWYYKELGRAKGPVSWMMLRSLAERDEIGPETLVKRSSDRDWMLATTISGLFDGLEESRGITESPQPSSVKAGTLDEYGLLADRSPVEITSKGRLRPCPDCGQEVSRRAVSCPHCGCPLATAGSRASKSSSSFNRRLIWWPLGLVAVYVVLLTIGTLCSQHNRDYVFQDDEDTKVKTNEFGRNTNSVSSSSKITKENFLKIHNGMNSDDVKLILGEPTEKKWPPAGVGLTSQHWKWRDGTKEVTVIVDFDSKELSAGMVVKNKWQRGLD